MDRYLGKGLLLLLALYLFGGPMAYAQGLYRLYESPMGEERWKASGNRLRCGMSLGIPNYGVAYFEQYATKDPHFIVHKFQPVQRRINTKVTATPPLWKPGQKSWFITHTRLKPGKYGFFLERLATLRMLDYLANGLQTRFSYRSDEGFNVDVLLSPVHFQPVFAQFQQCIGRLLPFNYEQIRRSVFHFDVDVTELSDEDKALLNKIAIYSRADKKLREIRIAGYTDDSGRRSYNNAISEQRAQAIADYLRRQHARTGIFFVTWYGEKHPVMSNDTEEGRAENRRVEVELLY